MEKNTQNSGTKEIGSCHARLLIDSSVAERLWSHLCVKLLLTLHAPFAIKKRRNSSGNGEQKGISDSRVPLTNTWLFREPHAALIDH